jgi:flagellar biosynthesis protein FliQ
VIGWASVQPALAERWRAIAWGLKAIARCHVKPRRLQSVTMAAARFESETGMDGQDVLDIARDAIWTIMIVSAPVMLVGLLVGVVIGLLQAVTQIQEATLVFVPKIIAIFLVLLIAFPFMGTVMSSYMSRMMDHIVAGG